LPPQHISKEGLPQSAALLGFDVPDIHPRFEVKEGDRVAIGQVVFRDRKHPEIAFVSPTSGTVSELAFGPRRTLSAFAFELHDAPRGGGNTRPIDDRTQASVRATLLERGLWPAFRTRPYGRMPGPENAPAAIFVTAVHSSPLAPDPRVVLEGKIDTFCLGVSMLTHLTKGDVYVCQSPGTKLGPSDNRVTHASFEGTIAAGLASTHIERLFPIRSGQQIWTIGYQDVLAIGHLFQTGHFMSERVISVTGQSEGQPHLLRTCLGANIHEIVDCADAQILSGSYQMGRESRFLGRFHDQVTLLARPASALGYSRPSRKRFSQRAIVPTAALDRALALDIPAVPLLRALSIADSETAERLGCLSLVEEDVAALSSWCTSGTDYGALLRRVLDELMADAA